MIEMRTHGGVITVFPVRRRQIYWRSATTSAKTVVRITHNNLQPSAAMALVSPETDRHSRLLKRTDRQPTCG
jgi:hypothetical protein